LKELWFDSVCSTVQKREHHDKNAPQQLPHKKFATPKLTFLFIFSPSTRNKTPPTRDGKPSSDNILPSLLLQDLFKTTAA
jgi:hypothetical protein